MGLESPKEGGDNKVGMVGGSHWCEHEGEGVWCTTAQSELLWLGFVLRVANRGSEELGGSKGRERQ